MSVITPPASGAGRTAECRSDEPQPRGDEPRPPRAGGLQRYLAARRWIEPGLWATFFAVQAAANTLTGWQDVARYGQGTERWEVATWESTSNGVWLLLVPLIVRALDRWPPGWQRLGRTLALHAAAALAVSGVHVLAMVALRKLVYALHGAAYDFGDWPNELAYEALKDVRTYAFIAAGVLGYRLLLWRLQGEASLPAVAAAEEAEPPPEPAPSLPERFLVKKMGKEFLLPTAEIEWVQALGNYVNLHRRDHDYPLRSTLAAFEAQLDGRFARVHRSYIVSLAQVEAIEPTEAGDARLRMAGGGSVPCSRSYLPGLRDRLAGKGR
jgi:DNA-binding LytR/AlgR family response regulator